MRTNSTFESEFVAASDGLMVAETIDFKNFFDPNCNIDEQLWIDNATAGAGTGEQSGESGITNVSGTPGGSDDCDLPIRSQPVSIDPNPLPLRLDLPSGGAFACCCPLWPGGCTSRNDS